MLREEGVSESPNYSYSLPTPLVVSYSFLSDSKAANLVKAAKAAGGLPGLYEKVSNESREVDEM